MVKEKGKISNSEYQEQSDESKATATRDLAELVGKFRLHNKVGAIGVGTEYIFKGSNGSYIE